MNYKLCTVLLASLLMFPSACDERKAAQGEPAAAVEMAPPPGEGADPASFRDRVFYEMWVRSFQDSDDDGIGDFKGAVGRLDELADLGVGGIWLMPTFPSPLADSGYDVAGYREVNADYGDLADLDAFIAAAHERNILVYLDMVFNHVSDEHAWFKSALTGPSSPYFDYFVWSPSPVTRCPDVMPGPFGTVRWTEVKDVGLSYFHQFYPRQPDLNFYNPKVREELLDVIDYWLARDVDGFRFDVPDRFYEVGNDCSHTEKTVEFHADLREAISGIGELRRGFVGELWGWDYEVLPYFGPRGDPMIFNFGWTFSAYTGIAQGASPRPMVDNLEKILAPLSEDSRWGFFLGNHDTPRFADIASGNPGRVKLAAAVLLTMPGVPYIWMGDELGLQKGPQVRIDWRDGSRTPYPWDASEAGYGFSKSKPHLAFSSNSDTAAYAQQREDPESVLNAFRRFVALRNANPALHAGDYATVHVDERLWVFERAIADEARSQKILVMHNFSTGDAATWRPLSGGFGEKLVDLESGKPIAADKPVVIGPGRSRLLLIPPSENAK